MPDDANRKINSTPLRVNDFHSRREKISCVNAGPAFGGASVFYNSIESVKGSRSPVSMFSMEPPASLNRQRSGSYFR